MKRICILLISLFITAISFGQSVTEVFIPRYAIVGGADKVPFVYRATLNGLKPNATYRYYNRLVLDVDTASTGTSNGSGLYMLINKTTGVFTRVTSAPNLSTAGRYESFVTDAAGSYTGWFMNETSATFAVGSVIFPRIVLNDGAGGTAIATRLSPNSPITVIGFGNTSADATPVRSTPATSATAKNFVMLFDNSSSRPVAGAVVEGDGVANTAANSYAAFYEASVNEVAKAWGTIIPNNLAGGITKIVQYSLSDGSTAGSSFSTNGLWAKNGGGTVSTVNATGAEIVLDGSLVALPPPASQTISFSNPGTKRYGDLFMPGATATSNLPVRYSSSNTAIADTIRINGQLYIAVKSVGSADITATQPGDDTYAAAPPVTYTLVVDKAPLLIKANKQYWLLGSPMPDLTATYTGFVNGDDSADLNPPPVITTTANSSSPIGHYPITVSGAGSLNYDITYDSDTMFIVSNKQPQTITFATLTGKVYGDVDFDPGAVASSNLPVSYASSDPAVASITADSKIHIHKAGTATITASQGGSTNYEAAQDVSVTLTVGKALLTVTAVDTFRYVGQANPTFRLVYSGFINGDNTTALLTQPLVTTTADAVSVAGKYIIEVKGAAADNYDFSYKNGQLTIDPLLAQTITFPDLSVKKYGDANFKAGAKTSSGLSVVYTSSDTKVATIVTDSVIHIIGAGTTVITASQPGNSVYGAATPVTQALNVQRAPLTIRANNQTKNQGEPNPAFTITYSGFVNGDDSSDLTTLPVATCKATTASVPGSYSIVVQGATSPGYAINHQPGVLTVLPAQGEAQDNVNAYISGAGQLKVNVYAVNMVKVMVQVFDQNGSRLVNTTVTLNKGFNSYQIPVGHLSPGIYNVRIAGGDVLQKTKIIIP